KAFQQSAGGQAIFTQTHTPIKCGGAPQKTMYLADAYWRKKGLRSRTNMIYPTPGSVIFGVQPFRDCLEALIQEKNIITRFFHRPLRLSDTHKEIVFQVKPDDTADGSEISERQQGQEVTMPYDF